MSSGLSKVPLFKHAVGRNIALHAVSASRVSTYLVSRLIQLICPQMSPILICGVLSCESECVLVARIQFVSP